MMITLQRLSDDGTTTIGRLSVDGNDAGFSLEDTFRAEKIEGKTRIPAGRYRVIPRTFGRFFKAYSADTPRNRKRFGRPHPFALEIENVPGFTHILLHTGVDHTHTAGCVLVGTSVNDQHTRLSGSGQAYGRLFDLVEQAVLAGEGWIDIRDEAGLTDDTKPEDY